MNISWWHWFKNKLFKIVHFVMAAELPACQGAPNTEELQAGWKAQQRRVTRLKIPKCFMQAWCIIVREMKCVFSEPRLLAGWLFCRDIEMWTGMEKLLDILYTRFGFFSLVSNSLNLQAFFRCQRCHASMRETTSDVLGPGAHKTLQSCTSGGAVLFHLSVEHTEVHWFWVDSTVWVCS